MVFFGRMKEEQEAVGIAVVRKVHGRPDDWMYLDTMALMVEQNVALALALAMRV